MRLELIKGKGLQPYYLRLVAKNGETLAVSEGYASKWGARRAAKKNFRGIRVVDQT